VAGYRREQVIAAPYEDYPVVFVDELPPVKFMADRNTVGASAWKAIAEQLRAHPDKWGKIPFKTRRDTAIDTLKGYLEPYGRTVVSLRGEDFYALFHPNPQTRD
jgi:hypothetical protein